MGELQGVGELQVVEEAREVEEEELQQTEVEGVLEVQEEVVVALLSWPARGRVLLND